MNARRMTTTLGALALGIATIGIVPAMAQTGGAGTNGAAPGAVTGGMTGMGGGSPAGQMPHHNGGTETMPPNGQSGGMNKGMSNNGMSGGKESGRGMSQGGASSTRMGETKSMRRPGHESASGKPHAYHSGSYRTMHHGQIDQMQAQNPEVDRLNQQSLEAARKNQAFTPSSQH